MSDRCTTVLEAILRDAEKLKGQKTLLENNVLKSIFADAYSVNNVEVASWPSSPLDIPALYESVILPPLRTVDSQTALRSAWLKRIEYEGSLLEKWTNQASADRERKPGYEKWLAEGRPNLIWSMEVDLFRNGDQRGSALRMLEHLKQNLTHKSAPTWILQFTSLVETGELAQEEDQDEGTK